MVNDVDPKIFHMHNHHVTHAILPLAFLLHRNCLSPQALVKLPHNTYSL